MRASPQWSNPLGGFCARAVGQRTAGSTGLGGLLRVVSTTVEAANRTSHNQRHRGNCCRRSARQPRRDAPHHRRGRARYGVLRHRMRGPAAASSRPIPPLLVAHVLERLAHGERRRGDWCGRARIRWPLRLPAIERSLRTGLPRYVGAEAWTLKNLGDGKELISVAPGIVTHRSSRGCRLKSEKCRTAAWVARTVDGTEYYFGVTGDARLSRAGDIFAWIGPRSSIRTATASNLFTDGKMAATRCCSPGFSGTMAPPQYFSITRRASDPVVTRAPGFRVELRHRLAAIRTEVVGAPVRTTKFRFASLARGPEQSAHRSCHRRR